MTFIFNEKSWPEPDGKITDFCQFCMFLITVATIIMSVTFVTARRWENMVLKVSFGMPTADAYSSGYLVLSHNLGLASVLMLRPISPEPVLFPDL